MRTKDLVIFIAGVAIGAVGAWKVLENKYSMMAQEEINSVKEAFSKKEERESSEDNVEETHSVDERVAMKKNLNVVEYANKIKENGYVNYSDISKKEEVKDVNKPCVISPDELGDYEDYEIINLTYYADKVLTDENDEVVDNVEETIGEESLEHFGEYENDSLHVRNDAKKCYYEVLLDTRDYYGDVEETMPRYSMED